MLSFLLLSPFYSRAQLVSCAGSAPQYTAAFYPTTTINDDIVVNCDMLQADALGGSIKAIVYGNGNSWPTYTNAAAHVFVEDWMGFNLTINLPTGATRPDVALADGPNAMYPLQPGDNPSYRVIVTYQIAMNAFYDVFLISNCGTPMISAASTFSTPRQLNSSPFVCDTILCAPHIDTWTEPIITNATNGFPLVHEIAIVWSDGSILPNPNYPGTGIVFPAPNPFYIDATNLKGATEDLDIPGSYTSFLLGPDAIYADVACLYNTRSSHHFIQIAYVKASTYELRYAEMDCNATPISITASASSIASSAYFPPRIEAMSIYNPFASPYVAKYEIAAAIGSTVTGCPTKPTSYQVFGYNDISAPGFISAPLNCYDIKSPCVAAGVNPSFSSGIGNHQYTTGFFPWASSSIYTRKVGALTGTLDPQWWEVNCGAVTYPWDVARSFHISNCSNTGLDLLSVWYDGTDVVYKTTANSMNFKTVPTGTANVTSVNKVSIVPNPAQHFIQVSGEQNATYTVTDIAGKVCLKGSMSSSGRINIESLPAGSYTFKLLEQNGNVVAQKISKN